MKTGTFKGKVSWTGKFSGFGFFLMEEVELLEVALVETPVVDEDIELPELNPVQLMKLLHSV